MAVAAVAAPTALLTIVLLIVFILLSVHWQPEFHNSHIKFIGELCLGKYLIMTSSVETGGVCCLSYHYDNYHYICFWKESFAHHKYVQPLLTHCRRLVS